MDPFRVRREVASNGDLGGKRRFISRVFGLVRTLGTVPLISRSCHWFGLIGGGTFDVINSGRNPVDPALLIT